MKRMNDLTQGSIYPQLLMLAIPLIATNFIQTAYNIIDMIWIGRLGSGAVVSVGTAGFFISLGSALFTLVVTGTGIKIAHSFGAKEHSKTKQYIVNGYMMAMMMAVIYASLMIVFRSDIIGFFNLQDPVIQANAEKYLFVSMVGTVFMFFNVLYAGIMNSFGNSQLSFKLNAVGFVINLILDPLLIFGIGGYLQYGVVGAAYATVIARVLVFVLSIIQSRVTVTEEIAKIRVDRIQLREVVVLGMPNTIQRVSFTVIGIIMAKIISGYGPTGIAVQKIGLQVESLSFMTIAGLHGAMSVFVGQNFGADTFNRIRKGYRAGLLFSSIFGLFTTVLFIVFAKQIFGLFVKDVETIEMGISYLRIIGLSQLFMCIEIVTMASFNGVGKTHIPAAVSLTFTSLRIPLALMLSAGLSLGINSVWWSISMTSVAKGILLVALFNLYLIRHKRDK